MLFDLASAYQGGQGGEGQGEADDPQDLWCQAGQERMRLQDLGDWEKAMICRSQADIWRVGAFCPEANFYIGL